MCWIYADLYLGVFFVDPDDLSDISAHMVNRRMRVELVRYNFNNFLRWDTSKNFYAVHASDDSTQPSMGVVRIDAGTGDPNWYKYYDEGGTNTSKYGP